MFVASTVAIFQADLKRLFAYSSVAQIGYIILGLSFDSATGLTADHRAPVQSRRDQGRHLHAAGRRGGRRWAAPAWRSVQGLGRRMPLTSLGIVLVRAVADRRARHCRLRQQVVSDPGRAREGPVVAGVPDRRCRRCWRWPMCGALSRRRTSVSHARPCAAAAKHPGRCCACPLLLVAAIVYFGLDTSFTVGQRRQAARPADGRACADAHPNS